MSVNVEKLARLTGLSHAEVSQRLTDNNGKLVSEAPARQFRCYGSKVDGSGWDPAAEMQAHVNSVTHRMAMG